MRQLLLYGLVYFKNNSVRAGVGCCCHNNFCGKDISACDDAADSCSGEISTLSTCLSDL